MGAYEIKAKKEDAGKRLDIFIRENLNKFTRSDIQKFISAGSVFINKRDVPIRKAGYKLNGSEEVFVKAGEALNNRTALPEDILLDIIYEDDNLLIVNKPVGMQVYPAGNVTTSTLVNALLFRYGREGLSEADGGEAFGGVKETFDRPGIVHRLDRDTSGLLICAKDNKTHLALKKELQKHAVKRVYLALVYNSFKEFEGVINKPLARPTAQKKKVTVCDVGREAETRYRVIENLKNFAYVECELITGRTHQIRVHMESIGHPLIGDPVYGSRGSFARDGQMLHAGYLKFIHPFTGEVMEFSAPPPAKFLNCLDKLRRACRIGG